MKHRASLTLLLTISCLLFSAFPAIAGEWKQTEDEQWQYIQDNGEKATGWLELEDGLYYLMKMATGIPAVGSKTTAPGITWMRTACWSKMAGLTIIM